MTTYTLEDFQKMDFAELFGFWCISKLDDVISPFDPEDYANLYREFEKIRQEDWNERSVVVCRICQHLAEQEMLKG